MRPRVSGIVCGLLLASVSVASGQAGRGEIATGVFVAEIPVRSASPGELLVERKAATWRAALAGAESRVQIKGDSVFVTAAGSRFRGALRDSGRTISGYWLQPSSVTKERQGGAGYRQPFATRLDLRAASPDSWRGVVRQVPETFTLYLSVYRDSTGTLVGAFRNHDLNSNGGANVYRITPVGDSIVFTAPVHDPPVLVRHAALRRSSDRLQIFWPDVGAVLDLDRRNDARAAAFFPRPRTDRRYVYQRPPETGDGWTTAPAADVGISESAVSRAIQAVIDTNPGLRGAPLIHSILVARRGKLVVEEYFYGYDRDTPHDMRSAGKTFAAVMLGAAMLEGTRISPQSKVVDVLKELGPFANPDPRKSDVTLGHLLTHSAGLACDDYNDDSPGHEDNKLSRHAGDWSKFTLDLPMAHAPGTRYAYCSANINLAGGALTAATKTWLPELFERTVARPLQFGQWHWNLTPTGQGYLGGGSRIRPRDLLKVGQAYLNGGVWNGRRIAQASWVRESTSPHMTISPATTGLSQDDFGNQYGLGADGYAWHLGKDEYAASGNGGQVLVVMPKLDLVMVFTGANFGQGWVWGRWRGVIGEQIIAGIRD
jgi:CubicO group peptidase (beta-lactamase class C family)